MTVDLLDESGECKDWQTVAAQLPGRTNKDCRKRWSKVRDNVRKGSWTAREDRLLADAVNEFGFRWTLVANAVSTRHADRE